jgi:hypothetical protein
MERLFQGLRVQHIERTKNEEADELAKAAARKAVIPLDAFFQVIEDPSMKTVKPEDWRAPIMAYLRCHYELDSNIELIRMKQRAKAYQVIGEELYKTSIMGPVLCYLSNDECKDLLAPIHAGACGGHIGARALTVKVFM